MKHATLIVVVVLLLSACSSGPSPEQIQGTVVAQVTALAKAATPYPTYTPLPTYTAIPVVEKIVEKPVEVTRIVTQTPEPKPAATETPALEPDQITATAQAEADVALKAPRQDGVWLVGVDIAPGVWRNNGTEDKCYWKRSTKTGDIIDNYYSLGGGTAYIKSTDFQFETQGCSTWTWLSD